MRNKNLGDWYLWFYWLSNTNVYDCNFCTFFMNRGCNSSVRIILAHFSYVCGFVKCSKNFFHDKHIFICDSSNIGQNNETSGLLYCFSCLHTFLNLNIWALKFLPR